MYAKFAQCGNWDEVLELVAQLTKENEQLKKEKQQLINESMNLKLRIKQEEKRKKYTHNLISEMK